MASKLAISVKVEGAPQTIQRLSGLRESVRRRVFRNAMTEAARKGVSIAKGYLKPRRTGLLSKAMAFKSKQSGKDRGYRAIGADRGFKTNVAGSKWQTTFPLGVTVALTGKGKRGSKPRTAKIAARGFNVTAGQALDPSKYAHLVEGGRKQTNPKTAKAMFFRVSKKRGSNSALVWAQKAAAVKSQQFMRPMAEKLSLIYPWIMEQHLRKVS
jgi:hypothetical protein